MDTSDPIPQPLLANHDSRLLDLAFALDTTSSMSPYIQSACDNIRLIVKSIVDKGCSDLRLALVEYRDHPPQERTYVTQVHDFSTSVGAMRGWLRASRAVGGGDLPEAVADALHDVLNLSWRREATKICVLVSDAPPHGLIVRGDNFPDGCPAGHDPMNLARMLAERGVTLYVAGCEPALTPYKDFFAALAYITGGQYVPLSAAKALTAIIVGGAEEELSLEQWMEQVNQLVMEEVRQQGQENVSHDALSHHVMSKLSKKGARGKQLRRNKAALEPASGEAVALSGCANMASIKSKFKLKPADSPIAFGSRGAGFSSPRGKSKRTSVSAKSRKMSVSTKSRKMSVSIKSRKKSVSAKSRAKRAGPSLPKASPCEPALAGAPAASSYDIEEGEIQMHQAHRMVQKSLMRNKIFLSK